MDRSCAIDGCGRIPRSAKADLCNAHYFRTWRHGAAGVTPIRRGPSVCSIDDCSLRVAGRGMCSKHYQRLKTHGDPHWVTPRSEYGRHGMNYHSAHRLVRKTRGRATDQCCHHCGAQADQWAFSHDQAEVDATLEWQWSPDPMDYIALCIRCHEVYDAPSHGDRRAG